MKVNLDYKIKQINYGNNHIFQTKNAFNKGLFSIDETLLLKNKTYNLYTLTNIKSSIIKILFTFTIEKN